MKPSDVKKAIKAAIRTKRTLFIHGSPGVGKSQVTNQASKEEDYHMIDVRLSLLDSVDLHGLPTVENGVVKWAVPDFLPRTERDGAKVVLFIDEMTSAPPAVQVAAYGLVLDRKLGDYTLPEDCVVIAAGNKATDRAVVQKMSKALANRFTHIEMEVDVDDWVDHAIGTDFAEEVIAFIRFRPDLLHNFDPQDSDPAFASPRSWEFISDFIKAGIDRSIEAAMFKGTVGEGPAAEFLGFLRIFRSLTDPDMILMSPHNAPIPDEPATLYATCGSLARRAAPDNMDRIITYAERLPPEFAVLLIQDAARRTPGVQATRAFIKWAADNRDVLI